MSARNDLGASKILGTKPGGRHVMGPGGMDARNFAHWYRGQVLSRWRDLDSEGVAALAEAVAKAQREGRQVFVMGNGGSAATASHWATDFTKTASVPGRPLVRCLSLNDNVPLITATANDLSFDDVFSLQLDALLKPKDLVIFITGSGNSPNLLRAAKLANDRKAFTVGLLGFDGGKLKSMVRLPILVPSDQYGVIEDVHMSIGHIVTFYLKQRNKGG